MLRVLRSHDQLMLDVAVDGWVIKDGRSIRVPAGSSGVVVDVAGNPDAPAGYLVELYLKDTGEFVLANVKPKDVVQS